jgi:hypothetical protein
LGELSSPTSPAWNTAALFSLSSALVVSLIKVLIKETRENRKKNNKAQEGKEE